MPRLRPSLLRLRLLRQLRLRRRRLFLRPLLLSAERVERKQRGDELRRLRGL